MPAPKAKKVDKEKAEKKAADKSLERLKYNVTYLRGLDPEDAMGAKDIVCAFYKNGRCPQCKGCRQPDELILQCKDDYLLRIESRPMDKWAVEFDAIEVRPKKKIAAVEEMGLQCNSCYLADSCPVFKADNLCGIDWDDEAINDPKAIVTKLINLQFRRVNRSAKIEEIDGGVPDQNLSVEIDRLSGLVGVLSDLNADRFSLSIKGSASTNNPQGQPNQAGGLLAQLLGKRPEQSALPASDSTLDVTPLSVSTGELVKREKSGT